DCSERFLAEAAPVTDIAHLALGVRDPARSLAFYRDVVGLEGAVREADFGFVLTTPKGITFSLIRGEPPVGLGEVHFGVALPHEKAVRTRRIERARDLLRSANLTVTEISHMVGFSSLGSFSDRFTELVGCPPSRYREDVIRKGGPPPIPGCVVMMWTRIESPPD